MDTFNQRLRRLRKSKGFTLKSFAQKIGVSPSTYRDWEYGAAIQGQPYLKMAEVLDISLYELLGAAKPEKEKLFDLVKKLESLSNEIKREVFPLI